MLISTADSVFVGLSLNILGAVRICRNSSNYFSQSLEQRFGVTLVLKPLSTR